MHVLPPGCRLTAAVMIVALGMQALVFCAGQLCL
jgi:hypothetical protein